MTVETVCWVHFETSQLRHPQDLGGQICRTCSTEVIVEGDQWLAFVTLGAFAVHRREKGISCCCGSPSVSSVKARISQPGRKMASCS